MRNIFDTDGLSREKRLEKALAPVILPVLEERFPVLLARALRRSGFASVYQFQSLAVLLEIELFDADEAEEKFLNLFSEEKCVAAIQTLVLQMDNWCRRLEYACLSSTVITLLKDLSGQISINISPMFVVFCNRYKEYLSEKPTRKWLSTKRKSKEEYGTEDFLRRLYLLLLASIRLLQSRKEKYREEIYSSGNMDPSLALLVAFLHNYKDIVTKFNVRWQSLPMFYLNDILKMSGKKQSAGTTWVTFETSPIGAGNVLQKGTYWEAKKGEPVVGYKLLSDIQLSRMTLSGMNMVVVERNEERFPEAALGYVTAVMQSTLPSKAYSPVPTGFCLHSSMLLLGEGKREVNVLFRFTSDSLRVLEDAITQVSFVQEISRDETLFKVFHDAFQLWISTAGGGQIVENFHIRLQENEGLRLTFRLDEDFPAIVPLDDEDLPSLRLLMNSSAWLFPYSWTRKMFVKSVKITVSVQGIRSIEVYNDLGQIDVRQAFYPFGVMGEKGAWLAFGCYEMACKPIKTVNLAFNWQHLPTCNGGLKEYYKTYNKEIDNCSFKGRIDQLRNRGWKPLSDSGSVYLFRTSSGPMPLKEDTLIEHTDIYFSISENVILPYHKSAQFNLGNVNSGFYRLVLTEPDMGFGGHEYRRLFADVMMYNSRARHKKPLPELPLSLLIDSPLLSYTAEEECFFSVGCVSDIRFSYIRPLSNTIDLLPDTNRPIALMEGPEDEGNLMIGIAGAVGENLISMYMELDLLQREINHEFLPQTDWYYRDIHRWIRIDSINVLRDDTGGLMHSGAVVLQFPFCITAEMTDSDGVFWICVAVHSHLCNTSAVRSVYLNVVEAEAVMTPGTKLSVPGVVSYGRIAPLIGERPEENEAEIRTRMSERIATRHRLLLPGEYEQRVLLEFPEIVKVKCFPGMDAKRENRNTVVTLAVVHSRSGNEFPLCTDELLCRIEDCFRQYTSPFVNIDVINPVYEEVTLFCGISLKSGETAGFAIQKVHEGLEACIAPWNKNGGEPVFGYAFSLRDMQSSIKEGGRVNVIHGMKLLQVITEAEGRYSLREYISANGEEQMVAPSVPWAILVPAPHHYVIVGAEDNWRKEIEFGDLEVDNTFVIK